MPVPPAVPPVVRSAAARQRSSAARSRTLLTAFIAALALALTIGSANAYASGGGGGSGGGTPPIQVAPDSPTLTSGTSEIVQVVASPAAPAGGETLTVTSSNPALSVDPTVSVAGGSFFGQFSVTAATVSAPVSATVTVRLGTSAGTAAITVQPAIAPTGGSLNAFPTQAAAGDAVTVNLGLPTPAPAGGASVPLSSDSPALNVPATATVPAGASGMQLHLTAGTVTAPTVVHVSAAFASGTVTTQIEIDPPRVVTSLALGATTVDGAVGTTAAVTISVPANGDYTVTTASSDPAVASLPATIDLLSGTSSVNVPVTTTPVTAPTPVTLSVTGGGTTRTAQLTVIPTPPPAFDLQGVTAGSGQIAGGGTVTGTLTTTVGAPAGGVTVPLTSSDPRLASVPASVVIPAGATSAHFPITVTAQSSSVAVGISARFQNQGPSAVLDVLPARGGTALQVGTVHQRLRPKAVGDPNGELGFYSGGTAKVESGQLPPGMSLLSSIRPGEFFFSGTPQRAGTYTFVLEFTGQVVHPYVQAYVWVITPT